MTGKDIFIGLSYIDGKYIEEAENAMLPSENLKIRTFRRPMLIAAIISLMLLLVGCTVVYLLNMQEIKLGEQEVTYDVYDFDPRNGEAVSYVGQAQRTQQVLTLAGLNGTPASLAAREWYEFLESYDPDLEIKRAIWGNIPDFGDEYYGYDIYTQEMKDKLDEILAKYGLKLKGKRIEFQTDKLMFKALGMENVLNPGSEAVIDMQMASYYENGNFNLHFLYDLPGDEETAIHSQGWLYYRNKACFIPDTAVLTEAEWEEWNYTTASGDQVLIVRSEDAASAWFFCDLPDYTTSLQISTIQEMYEEKDDGVPVAKFRQLTKAQLERVADSIDFSLEPKLVEGWEDLDDGAVAMGEEINGYRIDVESAFTDGWGYRIVLRITAPEGVALTDPDNPNVRVQAGDGFNNNGYCEEDGDGKLNTCRYTVTDYIRSTQRPEDGSLVYPEGYATTVYWEDIYLHTYDTEKNQSHDQLLVEGTWKFNITLDDADTRQIELLSEPITAKACTGWKMDGTDVIEEREITSLKLHSLGIDLTSETSSDDFFCFTGQFSYIGMKDGTRMEFLSGEFHNKCIDLDEVAYVQLADKTIIPMPGVDAEIVQQAVAQIPADAEADPMPTVEGGVELLNEPITIKNLAGYATDATGDMEPLYEYFTLKSFVLGPDTALALDKRALEAPDTEIQVYMTDGSQITLRNTGCGRNADNEAYSTFAADETIDLSQVDHLQLPDGTILDMP